MTGDGGRLPPIPPTSRNPRAQRPARAGSGRSGRSGRSARSSRSVLAASDVAGIVVLGVIGLAVAAVLALVIDHGLFLRDPVAAGARVSAPATSAARPAVTAPARQATGVLVGPPWTGILKKASIASARASCGQHDLRTPAGKTADFQASQAIDGKADTAWRCAGSGVGRTLTITLRATQRVVAVGLVAGYAGIDPLVGTDAFLRDRRVLTVRWTVGAGTIVQTLNPGSRRLQLLRIPPTAAGSLTMTILSTTTAGVDAFALSDIALYVTPR